MRTLTVFIFIAINLFLCAFCTINSEELGEKKIESEPVIYEPYVQEFSATILKPPDIFYVDRSHARASDSNPGTAELPWRTIQCAAKAVKGYAKVIVKNGTYSERVLITNSGTAKGYLVFEADGPVIMKGFLLAGNYLAVIGFRINGTPEDIGWLNGGIWIKGHYQYIKGNKIYNFINAGGIVPSWEGRGDWDNLQIIDNYVYGCNSGIGANGRNWLVKGNEIERLIRGEKGGDADYVRFFGENIVIKENYFHNTYKEEIGTSHVDIFQTYHQNNNFARNVLIERNIAGDFYHQGLMAEARGNSHVNIIVRNNIFADATAWGICASGITGLIVKNNIFYNLDTHGVGFRNSTEASATRTGTTGVIKNNIFMNAGSDYWKEAGCEYENGYNLIYPVSKQPQRALDIVGVRPVFVEPGNIIGLDGLPFTADDGLRPQTDSPVIKAGEGGINIGAY